MSDLIQAIYGIGLAIEAGISDPPAWMTSSVSRVDLVASLDMLQQAPANRGVLRIDQYTLALEDAVLVAEEFAPALIEDVIPAHDIEGFQVEAIRENGVRVHQIFGTTADGGALEGRVLPDWGWAFAITSPSRPATQRFARILDLHLSEVTGRNPGDENAG